MSFIDFLEQKAFCNDEVSRIKKSEHVLSMIESFSISNYKIKKMLKCVLNLKRQHFVFHY